MAKKKTAGIKKSSDRTYEIDKIMIIEGKRVHLRSSGYLSIAEAKDALPSLVEAKRREFARKSTDKTFDALCEEYEDWRGANARTQTLLAVHYLIKKHILPHFTGLRIGEALSMERVKAWYRLKLNSTEDSKARKNKVFSTMRDIIDRAWHWHYISSETHQDLEDLVAGVKVTGRAKQAKAVWTYEDEVKFLSAIPQDSIDYPMFSLFCYLGCRLGEFLGLTWKAFDQEEGTISIFQQAIAGEGGATISEELKTDESYRVDHLDDNLKALLIRYRGTLNSSEGDEFIFPSPLGSKTPLSRTEFRRRFNRYIELSGVPKIVPHGVRHSKATMLASVCRTAEEVAVGANFLGHSASMFMGTYVSATGLKQTDIINRLKGA